MLTMLVYGKMEEEVLDFAFSRYVLLRVVVWHFEMEMGVK